MQKRICHIVLMLLAAGQVAAQVAGDLTCEQLINPEGIDALHPRLSWQIDGSQQNLRQTAWQVIVASSEENLAADKADLWNSGRVAGDQSCLVPYTGVPLKSQMTCYWKVKVWTTAEARVSSGGRVGAGAWSAPARWTVGLLHPGDWKARWIGYDRGFSWDSLSKFSRLSARYFRKEFDAGPSIRSATLYIIGLGHYIVSLNGHDIGDQVLAGAPTDYTRSVLYNTFDVTAACRTGANAIGVVLGNGRFFTMRPRYKPQKIKEFGFPKLLFQLEIVDDKGRRRRIVSDTSWRFTADGPIRSNNEYDGEEVDATRDLTGWNLPGYDDARWLRPQLVGAPGGRLVAQMDPPIKVMATIKPISIRELPAGSGRASADSAPVFILDLGQNIAGWVQMQVRGTRGRQITLRYAESLQPDGHIYTANLRDARVTDKYTLSGKGEEVWHPVFVFHGFRYVEIGNYPGRPSIDDFEGQVVYDDLANTGTFYCSDTLLNQIFHNAWWSIADNYKGMPIDCPQRNERMPWLGDRATGSLGESYLFDNNTFYAKWLDDIEGSQRPNGQLPDVAPAYWNYYSDNMTWPGVYILVADMLYDQYADLRPIRQHYASMKKWMRYMSTRYEKDGIMTKDKYGDWCVPPESPELIHSRDSLRNTDGHLIATAYYYHLLQLMARFADLLHRPADGGSFSLSAKKTKRALNARFLSGGSDAHYSNNTVTANLLPLYFGMTPEPDQHSVFAHIVDKIEKQNNDHISTGVIGTQWLMRTLTRYGRADLAYRIASNKTYPGWGYMVEHGATTIWELWNGDSANPSMNSQNHVMLLGDLLTWFFQDLAGIAPGQPGFKRIHMMPVFPDRLQSVQASYRTPYGVVSSHWEKKAGFIGWDITVPPNTSAEIILPNGEKQETGSGSYHFEIKAVAAPQPVALPQPASSSGPVITSGFLYDSAPFPECHASTIAETPHGLVAAFFGGTKERNPDVCIYVCRKDRGAGNWSAPVNVANGIQNQSLRYPCWNPVLYQVPGGDLLLFYKIGPSPSTWKGWMIRSRDGGATWSTPEALPDGFLGPIKDKPVRLANGDLLCPSSTEGGGWNLHFEITPDQGRTWQMAGPVDAKGQRAIQPTILIHKDGRLQALCRSENRAILETWSSDNGRTWSPLTPTELPNNNSGIDAVTLADGSQLLVYNHVLPPPGETKGVRSPLNVAVSPDGKTWYAALVLESDTLGQYSYPSVIQSADGNVQIVYTWRRKKIRYVEIDPAKLRKKKIVQGRWPL